MNEFNLSEKVHYPNECSVCKIDDFSKVYFESDIIEFIELLKNRLHFNCVEKESFISFTEEAFKRDILDEIDKLTGDKFK